LTVLPAQCKSVNSKNADRTENLSVARCYVRNGVWGWSLEAQEKALADAGVLEPDRLYRDVLPTSHAKRPAQVHPEWLETRNQHLFRPTKRNVPDTVYVAAMTVLGVRETDLAHALAMASERRSTVVAVDSGVTVTPDAGAAGVNAAMADWARAKRSGQTQPGRRIGTQAAAEAKKARTLAKLPEARKLWRLPPREMATMEVAARVGLSVKTLYSYLGRREVAQRRRKSK
jgi:hypothetical protein